MEAFTSSWPCADGSVPARWQIAESFDAGALPPDVCVFERPASGGDCPCEISAAFRAAACVSRIQILSSARTCEVYVDDDGRGSWEYFGTIRALKVCWKVEGVGLRMYCMCPCCMHALCVCVCVCSCVFDCVCVCVFCVCVYECVSKRAVTFVVGERV